MKTKDIIKLSVCILVCQLAGVVGSIFTLASIPTWYATLQKPFFNPPNWLFGPAWIVLYTLMGISLFLVWRKNPTRPAMGVFGVQLVLNTLWSIVFFGLKSPLFGLVVIVLLWPAILITILRFRSISKPAALLLVPYILWVSFAAVLNAAVFILNG
jgi:tryptophan-rich sensory protein